MTMKTSSGYGPKLQKKAISPRHVTWEEWRDATFVFCAVFSLCTWRHVVLLDVRALQRDPVGWKCPTLANDQEEDRMISVSLESTINSSQ